MIIYELNKGDSPFRTGYCNKHIRTSGSNSVIFHAKRFKRNFWSSLNLLIVTDPPVGPPASTCLNSNKLVWT